MNAFVLKSSALIALALAAVPASAVTIAVANASFETLPAGGLTFGCGTGCSFSTGAVPGWVTTGATGQFQPGSAGFYNFVPDGLTVAYINGGSIMQTVAPTAVAGSTYTLTTAFGVRNDLGNPGSIRLLVGSNTVFATGIVPTFGNWSTYTASYTATLADVGGAISIELVSPGPQGGFDNVVLTSAAVPEPGTWALMFAGFGMVGYAARRRAALVA